MLNLLLLLALVLNHVSSSVILNSTPSFGVCYSPMHNAEYPIYGGEPFYKLHDAIVTDFKLIKRFTDTVRTYYSSYYDIQVANIAAQVGIKLYLGIYMTWESWYPSQVEAAIQAVRTTNDTIKAIFVGNENVAPYGQFSVDYIISQIQNVRNRLKDELGITNIPIGTVQRASEWLNPAYLADMKRLESACDIIGFNYYPFFDNSYQYFKNNPAELLNILTDCMLKYYPLEKLRLTETGYPTGGNVLQDFPLSVPSVGNAYAFYKSYSAWAEEKLQGIRFYFQFFDLRPDDNSMGVELEKHFGFYTWDRQPKRPNYPFPQALNSKYYYYEQCRARISV